MSAACGEAVGNHRPAVPGVCQEGSALQQLDGWSHGRPAGHVHRPQHWGDPGTTQHHGNATWTRDTHASKAVTIYTLYLFVIRTTLCYRVRHQTEHTYLLFQSIWQKDNRKHKNMCTLVQLSDHISLIAFLPCRVWLQLMISSRPLCLRPTRSAWPPWASTMRSWRLPRPMASSYLESTLTPTSQARTSALSGTLWVKSNAHRNHYVECTEEAEWREMMSSLPRIIPKPEQVFLVVH